MDRGAEPHPRVRRAGPKLIRGVWLELAHPAHAALSCEDCRAFLYDAHAQPITRPANSADPAHRQPRPPCDRPPCETCPKIPPGAPPRPESAAELTEQGRECWDHYQRCRAVNWQVPDARDPLVQEHAAMFREVEDLAARTADRRANADAVVQLGRILRAKPRA